MRDLDRSQMDGLSCGASAHSSLLRPCAAVRHSHLKDPMCVRAGFQEQSGLIATGSGSGGRQRHKAGLSFLLFCQPFDLMRTDRGLSRMMSQLPQRRCDCGLLPSYAIPPLANIFSVGEANLTSAQEWVRHGLRLVG